MPNRPMVLLSDADVLIDYRDSDLSILALVVQHLAPVQVVRDVVDEVDDLSLARCGELGLTVVEVEPQVLLQLATLPQRLSRYDRLSFHVCQVNDWICVTNDRLLRRTCGEHNVRTRWGSSSCSIWFRQGPSPLHMLLKRHGASTPTTLITSPRRSLNGSHRILASGNRRSRVSGSRC